MKIDLLGNSFLYLLYNGHGDVVQLVNESGVVENSYEYDLFGQEILTIEERDNAIRYAGEFYDFETGLYYLRARYYDPYLGRFISEDSYWGEDENPLSLHRYTYAHNDLIRYLDPTGHWVQGDELLNASSQERIIALTDSYWAVSTDQERKNIKAQANAIRNDASN